MFIFWKQNSKGNIKKRDRELYTEA